MNNRTEDEQAKIDEVLKNLEIKTGIGDPSSPHFGSVLTHDEERRIDDKGNPIVEGLPWGDSSTGLYLTLAVVATQQHLMSNRVTLGGSTFPVSLALSPLGLQMSVITTQGIPTFSLPTSGASLEIPSDLGQDSIKRKYVVEWLRDTAAESLALAGVDLSKNKAAYQHLGLTVAMAAENAILATGL